MNRFDSRLPKTTSYWRQGKIFYIKHDSFLVSLEEGKAIADLLAYGIKDQETSAMVIDNRDSKGAWSQELNELWTLEGHNIQLSDFKKTATLTNSITAAMQINRISRAGGVSHMSKGFYSDLNDEVKDFLEI
ncbi:hypothetical protein EZV73_18395 [Acidaminobacter sp. JC074]|uniref:hypothetical protein n=1 Tax=Acidaminobacter sp. JC074 TaxID=2530199 RepID=UPI001F0ECA49|nr:hypothetical protein [Acidaminobacter sp. JC074]MCH4889558.1 hypothetical protein [Acidaminobacter sp. JC074]